MTSAIKYVFPKKTRRKINDEVAVRLRYRTGNVWCRARLVGVYQPTGAWLAVPYWTYGSLKTLKNADASCEGTGTCRVFIESAGRDMTAYLVGPWDIGPLSRVSGLVP